MHRFALPVFSHSHRKSLRFQPIACFCFTSELHLSVWRRSRWTSSCTLPQLPTPNGEWGAFGINLSSQDYHCGTTDSFSKKKKKKTLKGLWRSQLFQWQVFTFRPHIFPFVHARCSGGRNKMLFQQLKSDTCSMFKNCIRCILVTVVIIRYRSGPRPRLRTGWPVQRTGRTALIVKGLLKDLLSILSRLGWGPLR